MPPTAAGVRCASEVSIGDGGFESPVERTFPLAWHQATECDLLDGGGLQREQRFGERDAACHENEESAAVATGSQRPVSNSKVETVLPISGVAGG